MSRVRMTWGRFPTSYRGLVRVMWWRHGIGGRSRRLRTFFGHGYHAGYHDAAELDGCDERCASILSSMPN